MMHITETTPLVSSSTSTPMTERRDIETGFHRYLSVERVESTLENRKVDVLSNDSIFLLFGGGQLIALASVIGAIASMLIFMFPALFACPSSDNDEPNPGADPDSRCFFPVMFGGPLAIGFLAFTFISCASCISTIKGFHIRKKSLEYNSHLTSMIHQLSYADSTDEPLTARDFVTLYQEEVMNSNNIPDLSFEQIREIKQLCALLDDKNPAKEEGRKIQKYIEDHWVFRQKVPWNRLNMIRNATLDELKDNLTDEYIQTLIEHTPGFFGELLTVLSEIACQNPEVQAAILEYVRENINRQFSFEFSNEEILHAMQGVAEGGDLKKCFHMQMSKERKITLTCEEFTIDLPKSILKEVSGYFRGRLNFGKNNDEMNFEDIPQELFEVFVHFLQGKKMVIHEDNVDQFLSIANYFDVPNMVEECQTPLLHKYKECTPETKLQLLESFPILKGRFQAHVDQECAKQFSLTDRDAFVEHYARITQLGLEQTVRTMETALLDDIDHWVEEKAFVVSFSDFIEKVIDIHSYLPGSEPLTLKLTEVIHKRLVSHSNELKSFHDVVLNNPSYLMVEVLYDFIFADQNQDQIYSTFVSVKSVKEALSQLKSQFSADQALLLSIKDWEAVGMMRMTFDEFIEQVLHFRTSIQTDAIKIEVENLLIDIIRSRVANDETHHGLNVLETMSDHNPFLKKAFDCIG